MSVTTKQRFMDKRRLQEEAEKYGCEIETHHHRRKIFTLRMGERWTYVKDPMTGQPIQRMREVPIDIWKQAIMNSANYLRSDAYREEN
ncbi:hypothetical protein [Pantoea sp. CCBC3-3-1]|uniref:hypothetical protein n=1 Tax=Pantoea sp. CCBC3-3-1 TaxID=2490851 RepID=UPI0011BDEC03|nr:hypothetical protein [Pantoea sp. CCBC3-3-1]